MQHVFRSTPPVAIAADTPNTVTSPVRTAGIEGAIQPLRVTIMDGGMLSRWSLGVTVATAPPGNFAIANGCQSRRGSKASEKLF
jgi:hypothetical protein